jgi:hypothetical protein
MNTINPNRLFSACCIALIVTAMTFAIRAGILTQLSVDFNFDNKQLGWINSMAFLGFPVAMMFGGLIYNHVGARVLLYLSFACHLLGLFLTITATGFWTLLLSSFFIGFANGSVEAACNPLIADIPRVVPWWHSDRFSGFCAHDQAGIRLAVADCHYDHPDNHLRRHDFWSAFPDNGKHRNIYSCEHPRSFLTAIYCHVLLHDSDFCVRVRNPAVG